MNFFDGVVIGGDIKLDNQLISLPQAVCARDGLPVKIGIRPKHLRPPDEASTKTHSFHVHLVEPTGDEMDLKGTIYGQPTTMVVPVSQIRANDTIDVVLVPDALHVFNATSGARLS